MSIGIVNKLDTPWGFTKDIQQDNWHIQYTNLNEICQGGPLVGNLIVNGQKVFCDKRFGGPLLYHENLVFIPMYIRKFCISGFMISVIELNSMRLIRVKDIYDLVYLDSINENEILFYKDIDRTKLHRKKIDNKLVLDWYIESDIDEYHIKPSNCIVCYIPNGFKDNKRNQKIFIKKKNYDSYETPKKFVDELDSYNGIQYLETYIAE